MTEPRRRVDQNEAFHPMDGPLTCEECGQGCGDFHKHDCPRNAYKTIAEVNGEPVLVKFRYGGFRAPEGLAPISDYLDAPGGVHDELERLRQKHRETFYLPHHWRETLDENPKAILGLTADADHDAEDWIAVSVIPTEETPDAVG